MQIAKHSRVSGSCSIQTVNSESQKIRRRRSVLAIAAAISAAGLVLASTARAAITVTGQQDFGITGTAAPGSDQPISKNETFTVSPGSNILAVQVGEYVASSGDRSVAVTWTPTGGSAQSLSMAIAQVSASSTYVLDDILYLVNPTAGSGTLTLTGDARSWNFDALTLSGVNTAIAPVGQGVDGGTSTASLTLTTSAAANSFAVVAEGTRVNPNGAAFTLSSTSGTPTQSYNYNDTTNNSAGGYMEDGGGYISGLSGTPTISSYQSTYGTSGSRNDLAVAVFTPVISTGDIWTGASSSDWGTAGNWQASSVPNPSGDTITFGDAGATGSVDLGSSARSVAGLLFVGVNTTVASASSNVLTLANGGSTVPISVSGGANVISAAVTLGDNSTINPIGGTLSFTGGIGGAGKGITMNSGGGSVTIANSNSYTGATAVNGGILNITGTLGNTAISVTGGTLNLQNTGAVSQNTLTASGGVVNISAVNAVTGGTLNINSGGVLAGSGSIGSSATVNVAAGGILSPHGNAGSSVATLTLGGNTTIASGGLLNFNLLAGNVSDLIVANNLTLGAGTETLNVSFPNGVQNGTYELMSVAGSLSMAGATITPSGTGAVSYMLYTPTQLGNPDPGYFTLATTVLTATWNGSVNGAWDINSTANWNVAGGGTQYLDGQPVLFNNNASNTAITVTAGGVNPASMTFGNNNATAYTVGGGVIGGIGSLTLNGSGTVTFTGASNTYTGGNTIGAAATLVGTPANIPGAIVDNGTLIFTGGGTEANLISGSGAFVKNATTNSNLLTFNGSAPTFTGGSTLNSGRILMQLPALSTSTVTGFGTGTIVLNGGRFDFFSTAAAGSGAITNTLPNNFQVTGLGGTIGWGATQAGGAGPGDIVTQVFSGSILLGGPLTIGYDSDVNGYNYQPAGFTGPNMSGGIVINQSTGLAPALDVTHLSNYTSVNSAFSNISDGPGGASNPLLINISDARNPTVTISGSNTYAGGTYIGMSLGGSVQVVSGSSLGTGKAVVYPGAHLVLDGTSAVPGGILMQSSAKAESVLSIATNSVTDIATEIAPGSSGVVLLDIGTTTTSAGLNATINALTIANNGNLFLLGNGISFTNVSYTGTSLPILGAGNTYLLGGGSVNGSETTLTSTSPVLVDTATVANVQIGSAQMYGQAAIALTQSNTYQGSTGVTNSILYGTAQTAGSPFGSNTVLAAVNLNNGTIQLTGVAGGQAVTKGVLTYTGASTVALNAAAASVEMDFTSVAAGYVTDTAGNHYTDGLLEITPTQNSLGTNEIVQVTSTAPVVKNGIVDPHIYVGGGSGASTDFATYGASGFARASYTQTSLAGLTAGTDVVNDAGETITNNPVIYALKTTGAITGTGQTITVNSGGMILGGSVASNITVPSGTEAVVIGTAGTVNLNGILTLPSGLHLGGGNTIAINNTSSGSSVAGNLTIDSGTTLQTPFESPLGTANSPIDGFNNIVLNGGTLSNGIGTIGSGLPSSKTIVLGPLGGTITNYGFGNYSYIIASKITGSGALTVSPLSGNVQIDISGPANDYTGGTSFVSNGQGYNTNYVTATGTLGSGQVTVHEDSDPYGLANPAVVFQGNYNLTNNNGSPTAYAPMEVDSGLTVSFTSSSPVMGSLSGGGTVTLGNPNTNDTNLTVGLDNSNSVFQGFLTQASSTAGKGVGSLTKAGTGTFTIYGTQLYSGSTTVNAGTLVVHGSLAATGGTVVNNTGTLVLGSMNAFPANTSLSISTGGQVTIANHGSSVDFVPLVSSLTNSGTIDITNNAMVLQGANIGTINAEVALAYANGNWNGTNASGGVITSSTAAADTTHLTAVGVATNLTSFEGSNVSNSAVLVKYTYYGDANLSGTVDGSDYSLIDSGYLTGATGWQNGDFNYDGVIDGSDYTLIDNAFNTQGAQVAGLLASPSAIATDQIAGGSGTSAVPEPASLGLLGIGAAGLLGRRKRRLVH